jgi:hypothetical protein
MTRRLLSASIAAVALAGAGAAVVPQHAASLVLVASGTVVVVAAVFLLVLAGPLVTSERPVSALDVAPGAGAAPLDPHGLRDARRDLAARHAPGSLPPPVHDRLAAAGVVPASPPPAPGTAVDRTAAAALVHHVLDRPDAPAGPDGGAR